MSERDATSAAGFVRRAWRRRLMVVGAAGEWRTAVADHFRALGDEVTVATDGVEALTQVCRRATDVVIMDLALPRLEGFEVAAILRRVDPAVRIFLTVGADLDDAEPERRWTERFPCFPRPLDLEALGRAMAEAGP